MNLTKNPDPDKYGYIMVFDLMHIHNFHCQMVNGVKMLLFLELIKVLLCMLIIQKKRI